MTHDVHFAYSACFLLRFHLCPRLQLSISFVDISVLDASFAHAVYACVLAVLQPLVSQGISEPKIELVTHIQCWFCAASSKCSMS